MYTLVGVERFWYHRPAGAPQTTSSKDLPTEKNLPSGRFFKKIIFELAKNFRFPMGAVPRRVPSLVFCIREALDGGEILSELFTQF